MSRHLERRRARPLRSAILCVGIGTALILTACSAPEVETSPEPPANTASPSPATPTASPSDEAPVTLMREGTAADNLPIFATVTNSVWATPDQVSGRAYVDALVGAGFEKAAMQVTHDQSTVGNPAESIQFSVRWGEECLVGQVGPAIGAPVTVVVPVLAEGTCLVGDTRPIDW
ncbi:MAG TPA: hypothetical protein VEX42_11490 [Microbacterium sp.]|nr:hypothetical protein [Microbacterium sp.]